MKKFLLLLIVFFMLAGLLFATGSGEKNASKSVIMGSSSLGGTWYPTAAMMAGVAMRYEGLTITVQASGGGTENVRLMRQNQYHMGLCEPNIANYAYRGEAFFKEDGRYENITFVTNLYPNAACVVVMKNGPIRTMQDYNSDTNGGKKYGFSPGSPGSGDEYCWIEIFSAYGVNKNNINWRPLSHNERVMAFKDRLLEGIGYTTAQPAGSIIEASAQTPIRILEIAGKERDEIIKNYPWYAPYVIKAGFYNGVDQDVESIYIGGFVIANKDVPEDVIYKYLTAVYGKGLKEVQGVAAATKEITLENSIGGNEGGALPFHKGAEKFYKEKGLLK
ncbi:MAG: TAXI family TRAP transporter solute-binding subunit [Spirochaetaceae bacterium]|nr:TAXI family TRAP transporter solute-binding subunit [Spirochaetaceae bacterium]